MTAASRTLPLGTYARVMNLENGRAVVVRVNDRGPFVRGRGIDLSKAAAERLGLAHEGIGRVEVTRLDTTASRFASPPERWSGTVHIRRRYRWHRHHSRRLTRRRRSRWSMRRRVEVWLIELVR